MESLTGRRDGCATGSLMTDRNARLLVTSEAAKRFSGSWTNAGVVGQEQPFESPSRGTTFRNVASGIWNLHRDFDVDSGFSIVFTNEGTLRKLSPSETVFHGIDRLDHREGSVIEVLEGKLSLPESGTQSSPSSGATFNVAANAILDLFRGTSHFIGTYTGTGDGRVELSQGTIEARDFAGGTGVVFDFEEGLLHWTGGTIRTDGVTGDSFINAGHMTWSGSGERSLQGQEFRNRGTIIQTDDGNSLFNSIGQGTFFHNEDSAIYENRGIGGIVGGSVFNAGIFRNATGDSEFDSVFYAAAGSLLDIADGRARFVNGGDFETSQISVSEDAILEFDAGSTRAYKLLDGATLNGTGGGRVEFSNGTIDSVNSNATLNFAEGMFHWIGGIFLRDITNAGHMTITGAEAKRINNAFENTGTVIQESGTLVNASSAGFTNAEGAVWEMQDDAKFGGTSFVTGKFINAGTLRKTGAGQAEIFDGGVALSHAGGTIEIIEGDLVANHSGSAPGTGGHFAIAAGSMFEITGTFASAGRYTGGGGGKVQATARIAGEDSGIILDFPEGMFDLATPGLAQNSGRITNEGFITFDGDEELRFIARLVNHGTIDQVAGQNVQLRNFSTTVNHGDWRTHGDSTIELVQFSGLEAKWYNFGLIEKLGSGTTRIFANGSAPTLSNSGQVAVREGTFEIDARSIAQLDQSNQTLSGGRWTVGETATLKFFDSEELDQPIASNFGNITLEAGDSTFASIDSLSSNGGVLDLRGDRQLSIAGDFVNGIDQSRLTLQSVRSAFSGRLVGLAVDPATGDVIAHSRNQRDDNNEPYFDRIDQNSVAVGEVIHQPGGPVNVSGIDLITTEMTIGDTTVPAGSLIFIHANETPATLYAIDVASGLTLASVAPDGRNR